MIGLLFLAVLVAWIATALTLGIKLPKWLGLKRGGLLASMVLAPLIFFAPVADEIIAYPQMRALCKSVEGFQYDKTTAAGRTVSKYVYALRSETKILFPGIPVNITEYGLRAVDNGKAIIWWSAIESSGGWLQIPAGSSGTHMSLILPEKCSISSNGRIDLDAVKSELKLNKSDTDLSQKQATSEKNHE